eukprot:jgi/Ulvmu1/9067/UM005_0160.1
MRVQRMGTNLSCRPGVKAQRGLPTRNPSLHACGENNGADRANIGEATSCDRRQLCLAAVASATAPSVLQSAEAAEVATQPAPSLADVTRAVEPRGALRESEQAIIDVFEGANRSVVNIFDLSLQGRTPQVQVADVPEGNGSGFIWSTGGYIVTNYHVLANILNNVNPSALSKKDFKVARVTLLDPDGVKRDYLASVAGLLKAKDLAVLKIDAPASILQPASIGQSKSVRVGQQVLAIGNPFGFDHTLTTGAVSGLDRVIQSQVGSMISGAIQTDAAINPGNSGGPLLDSKGRVIGVNTAIFTATGTSAGVGFAIPIDFVDRVVPQLIANGQVTTPTIGIMFASAAISASLKVTDGALAQTVDPKGPAGKAGLLGIRRGLAGVVAGDVIVGVDGRRIRTSSDVEAAIDNKSVGDKVQVTYKRGTDGAGSEMTAEVVLEADRA